MKIKLDENLPESLRTELTRLGHDVDSVLAEGLRGRCDADVFGAAQAEHRFFVTQDLDFSDIRRFNPGTHAGLALLRLHDPSRSTIVRRFMEAFVEQSGSDWSKCFVVISDVKVRIRKPAAS